MSTASTQPSDCSVLIAGAGPTGLVLALTLAKNQIPVRIIEKDATFHVGQRGSGIQPRTLELFNYLGTLPDVMQQSQYNRRRCMYEMPEGRKIAKIVDMTPTLDPTPDVPFRTPRILGQSHSEEIMREHLAKYGVHVELNTRLESFVQDADGVTAQIVLQQDGQDVQQQVRSKYLVSAEGAKSVIRRQLGLTFLGETVDTTRIVLADIHVSGISTDYWHQWGDMSTKIVMIRPTEYEGIFSVTAGGVEADTASIASSREALVNFVYDVTQRRELEFGAIKWLTDFRPNIRMINKFGIGRVFLVGDAAHVHSPTGGQGMNTGVQDSFNLAWKLSLVLKGLSPPSLLDSYNGERLPVVQDMLQRTTNLLDKTVTYKTGDKDVSFAQRPKALHQLGVNYRWSSIIVDEQPPLDGEPGVAAAYLPEDPTVLRAGDRAPDAPGLQVVFASDRSASDAKETSLFSTYNLTRHTVLLFDPDVAHANAILSALKAVPAGAMQTVVIIPKDRSASETVSLQSLAVDFILVDQYGHAVKYYPPVSEGFTTIIIRPDGVVGAVVRTVDGVKKYISTVFGA